jgi:hypothetical protein
VPAVIDGSIEPAETAYSRIHKRGAFLLDTHVGMHKGGGVTSSGDVIDRFLAGCVNNVIYDH